MRGMFPRFAKKGILIEVTLFFFMITGVNSWGQNTYSQIKSEPDFQHIATIGVFERHKVQNMKLIPNHPFAKVFVLTKTHSPSEQNLGRAVIINPGSARPFQVV